MVIHALEQAIHLAFLQQSCDEDMSTEDVDDLDSYEWSDKISKESFLKANALMNHFISQNIELMPKEFSLDVQKPCDQGSTVEESDESLENFLTTESHKIVRALRDKDTKPGKQLMPLLLLRQSQSKFVKA